MKQVKKSGAGRPYEANGFLVPVVSGSTREMGAQHGPLMLDSIQRTWDLLVAPGVAIRNSVRNERPAPRL